MLGVGGAAVSDEPLPAAPSRLWSMGGVSTQARTRYAHARLSSSAMACRHSALSESPRRVCRRVSQRKVLPRKPALVYDIIADIEQYPQFLPWCSRTSIESRDPSHSFTQAHTAPPGEWTESIHCLVDFNFGQFAGIPPASLGGVLHEEIHHTVWLQPGRRVLSVALNSQFCERICYDWRISGLPSGETAVELEFEIVLRSVVHAPAWDLFAKGVVSKVTDAFVKRVGDAVSSTPPATEELERAKDINEQAPVLAEDDGLDATATSVALQSVAEARQDSTRTSERQSQVAHAPPGQREDGSAGHASEQLATRARSSTAPPTGTLADNLVFGASSWILNTTASVVGVPLRVVPSSSAEGWHPAGPNVANLEAAEKEAPTRLALRRMPRAELIKELQVLERRVAALKSALREQPEGTRPPPERW